MLYHSSVVSLMFAYRAKSMIEPDPRGLNTGPDTAVHSLSQVAESSAEICKLIHKLRPAEQAEERLVS